MSCHQLSRPVVSFLCLAVFLTTGGMLCFSLGLQDFSYDDSKVEFNVDAPNGVVMEGYLFKRASNAFKTWNR